MKKKLRDLNNRLRTSNQKLIMVLEVENNKYRRVVWHIYICVYIYEIYANLNYNSGGKRKIQADIIN